MSTARAMADAGTTPAGAGAAALPPPDVVARVFAALGDPTRLRLVAMLSAGGAISIAQLTSSTDISRQAVTKHLQVLAAAQVVRDLRQGRERLWQLEPTPLHEARRALEAIGRHWDDALARLQAYVDGPADGRTADAA